MGKRRRVKTSSCRFCNATFREGGLRRHQRQCKKRFPVVYRVAYPFARRKIKACGFDRRTSEARIFEYAMLRFVVDRIECVAATCVLLVRLYLMFPLTEWFAVDIAYSGIVPLTHVDAVVLLWSVLTIYTRRQLIRDYRQHVIKRIERIGRTNGDSWS